MLSLSAAIAIAMLAAGGQNPPAGTPTQPPAGAPAEQNVDQDAQAPGDRAVDPSEPDFTIVGLPTTLRMPKFASAFRVTHRFNRSLGSGDFGDLASDLFGFDSGAQIGLEYRFGIRDGTQIGIHRTSERTIQFFGQHQLIRQGTSLVGVDAIVAIEGGNNFRQRYAPSIGAVISRKLGRHGAAYFQPIWINNTNPFSDEFGGDHSTFLLGLGGRLRVRPTVYLVGEMSPRVGYAPGSMQASFGIEKRAGGHSFQLNFSDGLGTTLAQIAKGGGGSDNWYIGFNISRKFF